jgi:hypothetical protein
MTQTITLKQLRSQLGELYAQVAYGGKRVQISRFKKPLVTMIATEELERYERLVNPRARFATQKAWDQGFAWIEKAGKRLAASGISAKEWEDVVNQAVDEVRSSHHAQGRP